MRPRTVTLRPELAAKTGAATVTVREDDNGLPGVYLGDERLRCFSVPEEEEILALARVGTDDAQTIRDADYEHSRTREWGQSVKHTRPLAGYRVGRTTRRSA